MANNSPCFEVEVATHGLNCWATGTSHVQNSKTLRKWRATVSYTRRRWLWQSSRPVQSDLLMRDLSRFRAMHWLSILTKMLVQCLASLGLSSNAVSSAVSRCIICGRDLTVFHWNLWSVSGRAAWEYLKWFRMSSVFTDVSGFDPYPIVGTCVIFFYSVSPPFASDTRVAAAMGLFWMCYTQLTRYDKTFVV